MTHQIKSLRLFSKKIFLLLIGLGFFISLLLYFSRSSNDYFYALIDKHALLKKTQAPRLILAGGSNLTFGIDSEEIQKQIGIPVINTSLHAGLGLKFMLNDIKGFLKQGDTVLIIPEYDFYFGNQMNGDETLLTVLLNIYPKGFFTLDISQLQNVLRYSPNILGNSFNTLKASLKNKKKQQGQTLNEMDIYDRRGFNEWGDLITHLHRPSEKFTHYGMLPSPFTPLSVEYLHSFKNSAAKIGVKVLLSFPAYSSTSYDINRKNISDLLLILKEKLDFPIISAPEDYRFKDDLFFNTSYHLNAEGRKIRTLKLIEDLKKSI